MLKAIFPEIPHSLDSTGDLVSAKQIKLHAIWKDEWGKVHDSASMISSFC